MGLKKGHEFAVKKRGRDGGDGMDWGCQGFPMLQGAAALAELGALGMILKADLFQI